MLRKSYHGASDMQAEVLLQKILRAQDSLTVTGRKYYVAADGSACGGASEESPIGLEYVSLLDLQPGDALLFRRGDCFRMERSIVIASDISYGAYGTGDKPLLLGSACNYACCDLWQETETPYVWKTDIPSCNPGIVAFNDNAFFGELRDSLSEL